MSKKVNVYDLMDSGDTRKLLKLIEDEGVMQFHQMGSSQALLRFGMALINSVT